MTIYKQEKDYWWDGGSGYGSLIQPLQFIFEHISPKFVCEYGTGDSSTPFFIDRMRGGRVISVEMQDFDWMYRISGRIGIDKAGWAIMYSQGLIVHDNELPDFVLSDGSSQSRFAVVNHYMDMGTETIVGHDTESTWYGWHLVHEDRGYFKYQFTDEAPYTTVWTKNEKLIQALKERAAPKDKVVYFMQAFGLGDIIFMQELANDFIKQGYRVLWGVEPKILGIQKHFPNVTFIDKNIIQVDYNRKDVHEVGGMIVYPLRWADSICELPYKDCMKSKYIFFGKPWQKWRNLKMVRDTEKEKELYYNILGLKDGERYNLTSRNYSGGTGAVETLKDGLRDIDIRLFDGYTLIDWSLVIERAENIHAVSSAILYLLELLELSAKEVHLYRRPNETDLSFVDYIFTNNYILHQ